MNALPSNGRTVRLVPPLLTQSPMHSLSRCGPVAQLIRTRTLLNTLKTFRQRVRALRCRLEQMALWHLHSRCAAQIFSPETMGRGVAATIWKTCQALFQDACGFIHLILSSQARTLVRCMTSWYSRDPRLPCINTDTASSSCVHQQQRRRRQQLLRQ